MSNAPAHFQGESGGFQTVPMGSDAPGGPAREPGVHGANRDDRRAIVSRETHSDLPKPGRKGWSPVQRRQLKQLRMVEGWTTPQIAELMHRTKRSVEGELQRRKWILYPRRKRPNALAAVAAAVARLEAEERGSGI